MDYCPIGRAGKGGGGTLRAESPSVFLENIEDRRRLYLQDRKRGREAILLVSLCCRNGSTSSHVGLLHSLIHLNLFTSLTH